MTALPGLLPMDGSNSQSDDSNRRQVESRSRRRLMPTLSAPAILPCSTYLEAGPGVHGRGPRIIAQRGSRQRNDGAAFLER